MLEYYNSRLQICLAEQHRYADKQREPDENYTALEDEISDLRKKIATELTEKGQESSDVHDNKDTAVQAFNRLPSQTTLRDPEIPSPEELSSPFSPALFRDIHILSTDYPYQDEGGEEKEDDGSGNTHHLPQTP